MKQFLTALIACIVVLTMADHMMRLDWANLCEQDNISCPTKLWWFE
jgi:hypothetical protein